MKGKAKSDDIIKDKNKIGFSCGWAPQTVTYTPKNKYNQEWKEWTNFINENPEKYLAIGEIGLDSKCKKDFDKAQLKLFHDMLDLATEYRFGINVHSLGLEEKVLEILNKEPYCDTRPVVLHAFQGDSKQAIEGINRGYYFSIAPRKALNEPSYSDQIKILRLIP